VIQLVRIAGWGGGRISKFASLGFAEDQSARTLQTGDTFGLRSVEQLRRQTAPGAGREAVDVNYVFNADQKTKKWSAGLFSWPTRQQRLSLATQTLKTPVLRQKSKEARFQFSEALFQVIYVLQQKCSQLSRVRLRRYPDSSHSSLAHKEGFHQVILLPTGPEARRQPRLTPTDRQCWPP